MMDEVHISDVKPGSLSDRIIKLINPKSTLDEFKDQLKTIDINTIFQYSLYYSIPHGLSLGLKYYYFKKGDFLFKSLLNEWEHRCDFTEFMYIDLIEKTKILLRKKNINLNIQDAKGNTLLHIIVKKLYSIYFDVCKLLILDSRLNLNIKNADGYTALDVLYNEHSLYEELLSLKYDYIVTLRISNILEIIHNIEDRMKIEKKAYLTIWCIKKQKLAPKDIQWMIWMKIFKSLIVDI